MKNTYRFFVEPGVLTGPQIEIEERELLHQWTSVLRLGPGSHVTLLDGSGRAAIAEIIALGKRAAQLRILSEYSASGEPGVQITLCVALARGERFEWVLQKGTELGVVRFVPIISARSLREASASKRERWQRIIREAAEQAQRGKLPELAEAATFAAALSAYGGIILSEGRDVQPLSVAVRAHPTPLSLWSGPEGGWSVEELAAAQEAGLVIASLGPRILRAETAPLAAVAAIMYTYGEWDSTQGDSAQ